MEVVLASTTNFPKVRICEVLSDYNLKTAHAKVYLEAGRNSILVLLVVKSTGQRNSPTGSPLGIVACAAKPAYKGHKNVSYEDGRQKFASFGVQRTSR